MRFSWMSGGLVVVLLSAACSAGPTERDINDSLDATLRSVAGDWIGTSTGQNAILLEFRLQEGANGQVSGTGTMKEAGAPSAVPIAITGTFQRPLLSLTFNGMVYETKSVQGASQGEYTSVGGMSTTMQLTGPGYSKSLPILLQEK